MAYPALHNPQITVKMAAAGSVHQGVVPPGPESISAAPMCAMPRMTPGLCTLHALSDRGGVYGSDVSTAGRRRI